MPIKKLTKSFWDFLLTLCRRRFLILEMAKRDVAQNQVGSLLGFIWTFINPLVLICILWIVFSKGFKTPTVTGVPFVVWLTSGLIIWNAFSESLNGATIAVRTNPHLVKKVLFPLSVLPVVKLVASLMVHLVFILILIVLILLHGLPSSIYWFQCIYYLVGLMVFSLGLGWLTSSLFVYIRDVGQVVTILLQFGFWSTPIFWSVDIMPESARIWLKLNPMFYLVQGYRESFLSFVPFWHHPVLTIYFWSVTAVIFVLGAIVFQRLRPSFADVL
jgi:lipopolysaccharide transport system permease protein